MDHASEIVEEIVKKKLSYREVPVVINYDNYSLKHGHGSFMGGVRVIMSMIVKKIAR